MEGIGYVDIFARRKVQLLSYFGLQLRESIHVHKRGLISIIGTHVGNHIQTLILYSKPEPLQTRRV